jgi:hypothetical protein
MRRTRQRKAVLPPILARLPVDGDSSRYPPALLSIPILILSRR